MRGWKLAWVTLMVKVSLGQINKGLFLVANVMASRQNVKFTERQVDKMASRQNNKLEKWLIYKKAS